MTVHHEGSRTRPLSADDTAEDARGAGLRLGILGNQIGGVPTPTVALC